MDPSDLARSLDPKARLPRYQVGIELSATETLDQSNSERNRPCIDPQHESLQFKAFETEIIQSVTMGLMESKISCTSTDPKVESPQYKAVDTNGLLAKEHMITVPNKHRLDGIEAYKAVLDRLIKAYAKNIKGKDSNILHENFGYDNDFQSL